MFLRLFGLVCPQFSVFVCFVTGNSFSLQSTANALVLEIKDMMAIKERKTDSVEEIEERVVEPCLTVRL